MRYVVNQVGYNVEQRGVGEPLLLLHGFTGSAKSWRSLSARLGSSYATIAIDFLGQGESDEPEDASRYGMEWCVRDLAALLDVLEIERANVLGYSMGGRVALHFAAAHPERVETLILESASPGIADAQERQRRAQSDDALAERIEREGIAKFVAYWSEIPLFASQKRLPEATRDALKEQRLKNNAQGLARSLRGLSVGRQESLWGTLGEIQAPTLLLAGALDDKYAGIAREMEAAMPNARCEIVADAGHTIHLERPEVFETLALDFLSDGKFKN